MEKRRLGRSEIKVSPMGMGCWAIGGPWSYWDGEHESPSGWGQVDDAESIRAIHRAIDLGVNFFDTADVYGCGHSERVLGQALAGRRDQVVIATKFGKQFDEASKRYFGHELSPVLIRQACEASLRRLGIETIDLYQFHWGDYSGSPDDMLDVLEALVQEGKIRSYGWSTDSAENARTFAQGAHCAAIQHAMHIFRDAPEILSVCDDYDLASINRGPLAMGLLTGKFTADTTFPADDIRSEWDVRDGRAAEIRRQLEAMRDILTSGGRTLAQGALGWIWARSERTVPIPGFKTRRQVEENASAMQFGPLTAAQMMEIHSLAGRV